MRGAKGGFHHCSHKIKLPFHVSQKIKLVFHISREIMTCYDAKGVDRLVIWVYKIGERSEPKNIYMFFHVWQNRPTAWAMVKDR